MGWAGFSSSGVRAAGADVPAKRPTMPVAAMGARDRMVGTGSVGRMAVRASIHTHLHLINPAQRAHKSNGPEELKISLFISFFFFSPFFT